jgi:PEP-CTERM motif
VNTRFLSCISACLAPGIVLASGFYSDNCPGGPAVNVAFSGNNASPGPCIIGFANSNPNGPPATATPTIMNTNAGLDFFNNGIGMVYDTSSLDQGQATGYTFSVVTNPTWDPNVNMVPTFLGLEGTVQIPDPTGTLSIVLTGLLGGLVQTITVNLNHGNCAQCTLAIPDYSMQLPAGVATETIALNSVGRVVYRTGDPLFDGETPEPGTLGLFFAGLAAVAIQKTRRGGKA